MTTNEHSDEIRGIVTAATDGAGRRPEPSREAVATIYRRWAPVYDFVFGGLFDRGRHAAIAASSRIGGRILDVGVGTGIALPHYPPAATVFGVDLSEPMLRRAQARVAELGLRNVAGLAVMDAERLAFPDASFDVVVAQYVVNTVPHPEATLDELARVLKPGGELVLLNRVGAEAGATADRRAVAHAARRPARLAVGVSLGALRGLGGANARRAPDRAERDAPVRPLRADPVREVAARLTSPGAAAAARRARCHIAAAIVG